VTSFSAQNRTWSDKAKRNTGLVMKKSVQNLANDLIGNARSGAGPGNIPVVTGNLRNSLMASTAPIMTTEGPVVGGDVGAQILTWQPETGKPLYLGWQAAYARRINYGFTGADKLGRVYKPRW
jgi:hypothetical protein